MGRILKAWTRLVLVHIFPASSIMDCGVFRSGAGVGQACVAKDVWGGCVGNAGAVGAQGYHVQQDCLLPAERYRAGYTRSEASTCPSSSVF